MRSASQALDGFPSVRVLALARRLQLPAPARRGGAHRRRPGHQQLCGTALLGLRAPAGQRAPHPRRGRPRAPPASRLGRGTGGGQHQGVRGECGGRRGGGAGRGREAGPLEALGRGAGGAGAWRRDARSRGRGHSEGAGSGRGGGGSVDGGRAGREAGAPRASPRTPRAPARRPAHPEGLPPPRGPTRAPRGPPPASPRTPRASPTPRPPAHPETPRERPLRASRAGCPACALAPAGRGAAPRAPPGLPPLALSRAVRRGGSFPTRPPRSWGPPARHPGPSPGPPAPRPRSPPPRGPAPRLPPIPVRASRRASAPLSPCFFAVLRPSFVRRPAPRDQFQPGSPQVPVPPQPRGGALRTAPGATSGRPVPGGFRGPTPPPCRVRPRDGGGGRGE
ncbi:translation initiation factor IF-2-like [Canis lupus familiaris]|uniref:translation initiation factor IF-2-like n=1 Tax=Canis lupus familiaris TaxID=9615 RepID=UPI0018F7D019|nr:translation initiation factor IF-2-like [Canis lupus familiaris]XP_038394757.1 translation initiation factor IF-2-like [Canis lupus familiaris]